MEAYREVCELAARQGGRILLDRLGKVNVREKGPKDLVTEADLASQEQIRKTVLARFPEHAFLGEEDEGAPADGGGEHEFRWIVDPLDGTTNYVHQLPGFSVSVAVESRGRLLAGAVFDPLLNECFTATTGGGAHLNGVRIAVSDCQELREGLIASSFPAHLDEDAVEIPRFLRVLVASQAVRRLGSAALNLSYLASGRLDGYWATSVKAWDVAAGFLLVTEAGGTLTNLEGGAVQVFEPLFVAASTPKLHSNLMECLGFGAR